jgi:hypothetical protein
MDRVNVKWQKSCMLTSGPDVSQLHQLDFHGFWTEAFVGISHPKVFQFCEISLEGVLDGFLE